MSEVSGPTRAEGHGTVGSEESERRNHVILVKRRTSVAPEESEFQRESERRDGTFEVGRGSTYLTRKNRY